MPTSKWRTSFRGVQMNISSEWIFPEEHSENNVDNTIEGIFSDVTILYQWASKYILLFKCILKNNKIIRSQPYFQ